MVRVPETISGRKAAMRMADIPAAVLSYLNKGEVATLNLVEWLAVDQRKLIGHLAQKHRWKGLDKSVNSGIAQLKKPSVMSNFYSIAESLRRWSLAAEIQAEVERKLAAEVSDFARSWAAYLAVCREYDSAENRIQAVKPYAADSHFGVREMAWMVLRPHLVPDLANSVKVLSGWSLDRDANIRRFASEVTRPRGVWCRHIEALKLNPEIAEPILWPLRSDTSKYVRDSVGNWLNDASKTRPDWVLELTRAWEKESPSRETAYIIRKAVRSIS